MLALACFLFLSLCVSETVFGNLEESGNGNGVDKSAMGDLFIESPHFRSSNRALYAGNCVPPFKYSGWCFFFPWMSSCKGKETARWKVYNDIATMSPTNDNIRFYVNTLFAPFEDLPGASYDTRDVLDQVGRSTEANECVRSIILNAFCNMSLLKSFEGWLDDILAIKAHDDDLFETIAKVTDLDLDILENILPEDMYMVVFKAAAAMESFSVIAHGLMAAADC
ncbi:hypothetical protein ACHAXS_012992 [Conticribra weissflogii]